MPLSDNLVAYWSLDEASGNAIDAHAANDLTETSGTIDSATGKVGNCRDFEAADTECLRIADNADLSFGDEDFTLQAWVNLESLPSGGQTMSIIDKSSVASNEYRLIVRNVVGTVRFRFTVFVSGTPTEVVADVLGTPSTGTWYHVIAWHDSVNNEIGIAVNAGTANTAAHSTGVDDLAGSFNIGGNGVATPASNFDGLIDEAGVWGRVLSGAERTELYNADNGRDYAYITGGGGGPTIVGQASETDTALAATARKTLAVGLASETDTALACTARKTLAVGQASTVDSALACTARKSLTTGLPTETDTALAVVEIKTLAVGIATETDTALGLEGQAEPPEDVAEFQTQLLSTLNLESEIQTTALLQSRVQTTALFETEL